MKPSKEGNEELSSHNVSEMGGDLILAQNSMPQNLMKIELEVPGML